MTTRKPYFEVVCLAEVWQAYHNPHIWRFCRADGTEMCRSREFTSRRAATVAMRTAIAAFEQAEMHDPFEARPLALDFARRKRLRMWPWSRSKREIDRAAA